MVEPRPLVKLSATAAIRLGLRTVFVGPFETFDLACAWVDDHLNPQDGDDYTMDYLQQPEERYCPAS